MEMEVLSQILELTMKILLENHLNCNHKKVFLMKISKTLKKIKGKK
jgi:hypothetical protein